MATNEIGTSPDQGLALPRGFRDILPTEARELHALRRTLMATFESYGYVPLEPPSVEFARAATSVDEHRVLRFLDRDGSLLALRPDLTTAVARVVAQRYRDASAALRLSYVATVFRQEHSMRGAEREYDQAGVELIGPAVAETGAGAPGAGALASLAGTPTRASRTGAPTPGSEATTEGSAPSRPRYGALADAEVISLLAEALSRCGLASAEIDVGHAGFVAGLLEDLGAQVREEALARARAGDLAGLVEVARSGGAGSRRLDLLREGLRYRGPIDAFGARGDSLPARSAQALVELRTLDALLAATGPALPVRYDLGLVASLPYYTGIVFQAIAPGLGFAVASGGRYDELLARYGAARPASGFGIAIPHLHQAVVAEGWRVDDASPLVTLEGDLPADVLRIAAALRREGLAVAIGETADSAGRAVVALRVLDGGRVELEGRPMTIAEAAAAIRGRSR